MTELAIVGLILMAAFGSFCHYYSFGLMSRAFAAYGGEAILYFVLGSIMLLCGVALIALTGILLSIWITAGD